MLLGKEVFNFFTIYNLNGFVSILIFNILMFFMFYKILNIKLINNLENYTDFLKVLKNKYSIFNNKIFLLIINTFLAASFYIMVVALCSLFNYQFGFHKIIINFIIVYICYIVFYKDNINFLLIFNKLLMPFLIVFLIFLSVNNINFENLSLISSNNSLIKSIFYGLLYLSFNSIVLIPILFNFKIKNKKQNLFLALLFTIIVFILTFLINLLLLSHFEFIKDVDLPILAICNEKNSIYSYCYFFMILSAVLSTLFSSGYSFISNVNKKNKRITLIIFLSLSFIFPFFSFSNLINTLYPLFGLLGLIQIFIVLIFKNTNLKM